MVLCSWINGHIQQSQGWLAAPKGVVLDNLIQSEAARLAMWCLQAANQQATMFNNQSEFKQKKYQQYDVRKNQ